MARGQNKRMPSKLDARIRLLALCLSVLFRSVAYVVVTILTIQSLQNGVFTSYQPGVLAAWLGLCAIGPILFSPAIGAVSSSKSNRAVVIVGSLIFIGVLSWAKFSDDVPWISIAAVLSLEAAFFGSAKLAITLPLAIAAGVPQMLPRWLMVLSAIAGASLVATPFGYDLLATPHGAFIVALLSGCAIPFARGSPAEPINLAAAGIVRPYWSGLRAIFRDRFARCSLIGLALWSFTALAVLAVFVRTVDGESARSQSVRFLVAMICGVLVCGLNRHVFRHSAFIVFGPVTATAGLIWLRCDDSSIGGLCLLGLAIGMALSPLVHAVLNYSQPRHHGVAASCIMVSFGIGAIVLAIVAYNLGAESPRIPLLNLLLGVTAVATLTAIILLFRPALEAMAEVIVWPLYRVRLTGPGVVNLPLHGPCLVIGNHAAWFDPLFLAKVLPAPTTPMMTSKFYDLPVLSFLMRHIIGTIRVPDIPIRHEAPELKEAVAALDRGEYVVLFPEGYLRRKEETPLRRFGRGVWRILSDRPSTPIFACWIEGSWGSFFSHRGGPPTKGKRFDFLRRIRIGIVGPILIDAETLADHMATRTYLMQKVIDAREPLGLPPIDLRHEHAEDENE